MTSGHPTLSIVIPTLNEAAHLPYLLQDLGWQKNIQFEIIVVDGGSTDETLSIARAIAKDYPYPLNIIESNTGRASQLNKGAGSCHAEDILFLHADSRVRDASLLFNAQVVLNRRREKTGNKDISGHFPLRFLSSPGCNNNYYYYESKTYLNKPDCINGDQGFWISKPYLDRLGGFDESLPYMEDAKLARKILADNNWLTLPGELETSARRFEVEGFTNRQILNSFLCNFNAIGEENYFNLAKDIYKQQDHTGQLKLKPFLALTHRYMNSGGIKSALNRWYKTGSYISSNAWQLPFALDCRKNKKQGRLPGNEEMPYLEFYDKHLAGIADWPAIKFITSILTVAWFYSLFLIR